MVSSHGHPTRWPDDDDEEGSLTLGRVRRRDILPAVAGVVQALNGDDDASAAEDGATSSAATVMNTTATTRRVTIVLIVVVGRPSAVGF